MAVSLTWPLLISLLRLLFISTLTLVNWAALYQVVSSKRYKTGQRQERLLVTTIIVVSLVYLSVVWAPFTFTALKHDLSDLQAQRDLGMMDPASHVFVPKTIKFDGETFIHDPDRINEPVHHGYIPKTINLEGDTFINNPTLVKEDELTVELLTIFPSPVLSNDITENTMDKPNKRIGEHVDLASYDGGDSRSVDDASSDEFTLEYVDLATGKAVDGQIFRSREERSTDSEKSLDAEWSVLFHMQPDNSQDDLSIDQKTYVEDEIKPDVLFWNSDVQDFVTSSCAYSLAFTAVLRLVIVQKFMLCPDGPWVLGIWSGLVVGVPGAITLLVRNLAGTSAHFAPHQPEYSSTGYFLYNIICDVHISEEYVVSIFLEWASLFTLLLITLAGIFAVAGRTSQKEVSDSYGPLQQEGSSSSSSANIETWSRDAILTIGAIWSWPAKPILVLILFCLYGSHWTNLVCWISHVVVAIPVVFVPLAVFLSRYHQMKSPMDIYVIDQDPHLGDDAKNSDDAKDPKGVPNGSFPSDAVDEEQTSNEVKLATTPQANDQTQEERGSQGRGYAKENLKFCMDKEGVFKYGLKSTSSKEEDKQIILDNEWGDASISEA